jgi:hypothetical protein
VDNSNTVRGAKRRDYLTHQDTFFGYQSMYTKYVPCVQAAFASYAASHVEAGDSLQTLRVYGELCGGGYPHPDVKAITPITSTTTTTTTSSWERKAATTTTTTTTGADDGH